MTQALVITGPTASGKSALAYALADRFNLEVITVDSAQVYTDMDIGTAKPSAEVLAVAPHHLIDIIDPAEFYSAWHFVEDANRLIKEITARGKIPLLVGGTMMYYHTLEHGLNELPVANATIRAALNQQASEIGWPAMHDKLERIDAVSSTLRAYIRGRRRFDWLVG